MRELNDKEDIAKVINQFYEKVKKDDLISFFFNKVVLVDWDRHLPVMYEFWEQTVFGTGNYRGNPMSIHLKLNQKSPITPEHLSRWVDLFTTTVDELYSGENAERMKQRAISIATIMQIKLSSP